MKRDVNTFAHLFLTNTNIQKSSYDKYPEATRKLLDAGILVDSETDESIICEGKYYEQVFENKLVLTILPTGKCNLNCTYCLEAEQKVF